MRVNGSTVQIGQPPQYTGKTHRHRNETQNTTITQTAAPPLLAIKTTNKKASAVSAVPPIIPTLLIKLHCC